MSDPFGVGIQAWLIGFNPPRHLFLGLVIARLSKRYVRLVALKGAESLTRGIPPLYGATGFRGSGY